MIEKLKIENVTELWRQQECLWKVTNINNLNMDSRKTAMLNISKEIGGINTNNHTLYYRPTMAHRFVDRLTLYLCGF